LGGVFGLLLRLLPAVISTQSSQNHIRLARKCDLQEEVAAFPLNVLAQDRKVSERYLNATLYADYGTGFCRLSSCAA
jgi:AraC-like DNA-binding protein